MQLKEASNEARADFAKRHTNVKSANDFLTQFNQVSKFNQEYRPKPLGYISEPGDLFHDLHVHWQGNKNQGQMDTAWAKFSEEIENQTRIDSEIMIKM